MSMSDLTPTQRVQKETLAVVSHPQYRPLGGIVMMGKTTIDDSIPTACTDGVNTQYNPDFVSKLNEKELRFVELHEAMHKAKRDLIVWAHLWKENPSLANQACDFVNNLELVKSDPNAAFIQMPEGGCLDWRFDGMDTGEVFRILKQEEEQAKKSGKPSKSSKPGFDQHNWEAADSLTPEEVSAVEREVKTALQQGLVLSKNMAGDVERLVNGLLEPKINWSEEMREFALQACSGKELSTWRKPNRRSIARGVYMPSTYSERIGRLLVGVDMSGSIGGTIISLFLGTVAKIAREIQPEVIDLLYWDTRVTVHEKYGDGEYETLTDSTKPKGGGGTRPSCVSQYIQQQNIRPECILILTDGEVGGDWGSNWNAPVLWCIAGKKNYKATTGKTIHIEE